MDWFAYAIWAAICVAKAVALVAAWVQPSNRDLTSLRAYLVISLMGEGVEFTTLRWFGFSSAQYRYAYYASDLTVTVLGFFVLVHLLELSFARTSVRLPGVRSGAIVLFSGVATISAVMTFQRFGPSLPGFSAQLEESLSFVGVVLTLLLWVTVNLMHLPGLNFRRVVLAFGILYSSGAFIYALHALFQHFSQWTLLVPLSTLLEASLLAYTLMSPEIEVANAREPEMVTARKPA